MYEVKIFDGPTDVNGTIIHSPYNSNNKLSSASVKLVLDGISNMRMSLNAQNGGFSLIRPLRTLVQVRNNLTNEVIFTGRVLMPKEEMSDGGFFAKSFEVEDVKAYLYDSCQRYGEYHDISVRDFLQLMITNHNNQVEPHKRFTLGTVNVTDSNDSLYRYLGYENTYDTIKDKLLDRLGGFLVVRNTTSGLVLDYVQAVGENSNTPIKLRTNLKNISREINPLNIITRLVPLGATIDSEEEEATEASKPRLTIASVNDGIDYLDDEDLISEFGIIEKSIEYDDVTTASTLKLRGEQYLASQAAAAVTYTLTAVNLNLVDSSFDAYKLGNWHNVENAVLNIGERVQIVEMELDLFDPTKSKLTIGEKYRTLSAYQASFQKTDRKVVKLEATINSQNKTIRNLKTQLSNVNNAVDDVQNELNDADLSGLTTAINALNDAIDDLETLVNNIPTYSLVTATTNGIARAADKAKTDLLTVTNAIDLDDIVQRLEALENI